MQSKKGASGETYTDSVPPHQSIVITERVAITHLIPLNDPQETVDFTIAFENKIEFQKKTNPVKYKLPQKPMS